MATSSSIFSTHGSTPPKSARRTVGGMYSFAVLPVPTRLRLLPSSPRVNRSLRLLCEVVGGGGTPSVVPEAGRRTNSERGVSSEGVDVDVGGGGVGAVLVDGGVGVVAFKLTFRFCQRPCMDLLRALGPWLTRCDDCGLIDINSETY
jgi:hypothetical protein